MQEEIEHITIVRVWSTRFGKKSKLGRMFDFLCFNCASAFKLLRDVRRGDVVVCMTDPPLLGIFIGLVCKLRGALLVNWLQDLFPEVAIKLRIIRLSPLAARVLTASRNLFLRTASLNVVIGEIMAQQLRESSGAAQVMMIPNWADGTALWPVNHEENPLRDEWSLSEKFVICYSGNIGLAHDLDSIVMAAEELRKVGSIVFLIIGAGEGLNAMERRVSSLGLRNVQFKPFQSPERLCYSLSVADVHLVSLKPELEGLIVPSKLYGVMAVGRSTIFLGSNSGEFALMINSLGQIGEVCGDSSGLVRAVLALHREPQTARLRGQLSRKVFEEKFDAEIACLTWKSALQKIRLNVKT